MPDGGIGRQSECKESLNTLKGMVAARYGRIGNWILKSQETLQGKKIPEEEPETV
jgi:hypothetical protein